MPDLPDLEADDLASLLEAAQGDGQPLKPWEQRVAPGMGGFSGAAASGGEENAGERPARACQELGDDDLPEIVDRQTDLAHLPMVDRHTTPDSDMHVEATSNEELWRLFVREHLYDTRRVTLDHFHLFEWFPVSPGTFHTPAARQQRQMAYRMMEQIGDDVYFNPQGKASMLRGGVGTIRLRPRMIDGESHYFMTASSSGVCHEGFPVLVPRRFYRTLKARMLAEGAAPVTLSGEMRYVPQDTVTFFERRRDVPQLYLHVDDLSLLPAPRAEVTGYLVSVAVSFVGAFEGHEGTYATFASFDPASRADAEQAVAWLEQVYVSGQHRGVVITDFDEVHARFPDAVFGLPALMAGRLKQAAVEAWLRAQGYDPKAGQVFLVDYQEINTQGGAYIAGDLHVEGDFVGRDQIVTGG